LVDEDVIFHESGNLGPGFYPGFFIVLCLETKCQNSRLGIFGGQSLLKILEENNSRWSNRFSSSMLFRFAQQRIFNRIDTRLPDSNALAQIGTASFL